MADASRRSTQNSAGSSPDDSVRKLGFYLLQQLEQRIKEFTSGAEALCISAKTLRLTSKLRDLIEASYAHADEPAERTRQGSRFTADSEVMQDETPEQYLKRIGVGQRLLDRCAVVSSIEVDGKGDKKKRVFDFTCFRALRCVTIKDAQIETVFGVSGVASLILTNALLLDDPAKFLTLRRLSLTSKDLYDMRNIPALCFSLRFLTVHVVHGERFVPNFHPTAPHLRIFDRATCAVEPWDGLSALHLVGIPGDPVRRIGVTPSASLNSSVHYLHNLRALTLSGLKLQSLTGVEVMCGCTQLLQLDLSHNALRDLQPADCIPKSVTHLNVSDNFLNGPAIESLAALAHLERLDVSANDFTLWTDFEFMPPTVRSVTINANPVHGDNVRLFENRDEYLRFVCSAVLRHCSGLVEVDGTAVAQRHMRPDADSEVKRWRATVANLRAAASRYLSGELLSATVPATAKTAAPAVSDPAVKGVLKRTKVKSRKGVRARSIQDANQRPTLVDPLLDMDSSHDHPISLVADAAARRARSTAHYLEHPMFRTRTTAVAPHGASQAGTVLSATDGELPPHRPEPAAPVAAQPERVTRRQPTTERGPVLLDRFKRDLRDRDWLVIDGDKRKKIFPSGVEIDESMICEENAAVWEVRMPGGGKAERTSISIHESAREFLFRDSRREAQRQDLSRFHGKILVRVVEAVSGRTRYVKIESKARGGSFGGQRPSVMVMFPTPHETATSKVRVTAAYNDTDEATTDEKSRPRSSTLTEDGSRPALTLTTELTGQIGRVLHTVEDSHMLAAFAIPLEAAELFLRVLEHQVVSCLGALVSSGIVRQWPLHIDSGLTACETLDQALPVIGSAQFFLDQVRSTSESCVASRQRHGCESIVAGDDQLESHLHTRVFKSEEPFNAVIYTHLWFSHDEPDPAKVVARASGKAVILAITGRTVMWAEDRNFIEAHPGVSFVKEALTFGTPRVEKLADLIMFEVSFDAQQFALHFKSGTMVCYPLDRSATQSIAGALAQVDLISVSANPAARGGGRHLLEVKPCLFPFFTSSPLIFSVSIFSVADPDSAVDADDVHVSDMFPIRHLPRRLASSMQLGSFVITATDVIVATVKAPLRSTVSESNVIVHKRNSISAIRKVQIACDDVFPLLFLIDFGPSSRWLLCAPHPATIASIVKELQRTSPGVTVGQMNRGLFARATSEAVGSEQSPSRP
jgi:hypothetical protein